MWSPRHCSIFSPAWWLEGGEGERKLVCMRVVEEPRSRVTRRKPHQFSDTDFFSQPITRTKYENRRRNREEEDARQWWRRRCDDEEKDDDANDEETAKDEADDDGEDNEDEEPL